jgi:protein O-mannosyl-transferase
MALALALVCIATFFPSLDFQLLDWVDDINITSNANITSLSEENLAWMFTDLQQALRYKPLNWLSWAIIYAGVGLQPGAYHATNLALHAINCALLFFLIIAVVRRLQPEQKPAHENTLRACAALAALWWALHPMRTEPVAWATGLPYHQALSFSLLALLCYLRSSNVDRGGTRWIIGAAFFYLLALFTYPICLTLSLLIPIIDVHVTRQASLQWRPPFFRASRRWWIEKAVFFTPSIIFIAIAVFARLNAQGIWQHPTVSDGFGAPERLAQGAFVWCWYLVKSLAPTDLVIVNTVLVKFRWYDPYFVASFAVIAIISILLIHQRRRVPGLLALWIGFLAVLIPAQGWTEHPHYPSDRYSIIAAVILSVGFGVFLCRRACVHRHRVPLLGVAAMLVMLCGFATREQLPIWRNNVTVFAHILSSLDDQPYYSYYRFAVPDADMPQVRALEIARLESLVAAGTANAVHLRWLGSYRFDERNSDLAIDLLQRSVAMNARDPETFNMLGFVYSTRKQWQQAQAALKTALALDDKHVLAHHNLGMVLQRLGQTAQANEHLRRARELGPQPPSR